MVKYNICEKPFQVFGVPNFDKTHVFERLPAEVRREFPNLETMGRRTPGARVGFRTDSEHILVRMTLETLSVDIGMSLFSCQAVYVFAGERTQGRYLGLANVPDYSTKTVEKVFTKGPGMEEILLVLPRNEIIASLEIELDEGCRLTAPTPYARGPVVFYGSSITEGGCPASGFNAYTQILSRMLDCDYTCMGFSGSAKGELGIADFILTLPMKAFVYDYDHNAPDAEWLEKTHEPFFLRIREAMPDLPILIMTKPDFDYSPANARRREVIYKTYQNALARGDKKVWFLDGETFFGDTDRHLCTIDTCHPNDLGFYRMAHVIEPVLKDMLDHN